MHPECVRNELAGEAVCYLCELELADWAAEHPDDPYPYERRPPRRPRS